MDPPPLNQSTGATVQVVPTLDTHDGTYVGVVLIKERFAVTPDNQPFRAGDAEIRMADELFDPENPDTSTVELAADFSLRRPSTEVLIKGSAKTPLGRPTTQLDVHLRVGPIAKSLRVFGPRAWYDAGMGRMVPTPPGTFDTVPIRWENAWGGSDFETDPANPIEEPRNPRGLGLVADPKTLAATAVPQIEDPNDPIESHRSRPRPMGLGPIGRGWAPRRDYAGTYDETWMTERMPLDPLDFDDRFNLAAPPDQIAPQPLRGGERFELLGMSAEGPIAFALPKLRFFVGREVVGRRMTEHEPQLDRIFFDAESRSLEMTWRSVVPLPRQMRKLRTIQVHEKRFV